MKNEKTYKLAVAGCKDTTYELMRALISENYEIDILITIDGKTAEKNKVAGYFDLEPFGETHGIDVYICDSYDLKSNSDKAFFGNKFISTLIVIGWQRLIPSWLLNRIKIGAFGMHGSSYPLPSGRGRSPLNWSLIQNKELFITNLFRYNADVDAGKIIGFQSFEINPFDDAKTLHYKNTLSMILLLRGHLSNIMAGHFKTFQQLNEKPTYYPKRTANDGIIFWNKDSMEIYNLIRAVTRPFHGSFSYYKEHKLTIWKGFPFDNALFNPYEYRAGEVIWIFENGDFVVKTGSGSMLITEYECSPGLSVEKGMFFDSGDFNYRNPFDFPS